MWQWQLLSLQPAGQPHDLSAAGKPAISLTWAQNMSAHVLWPGLLASMAAVGLLCRLNISKYECCIRGETGLAWILGAQLPLATCSCTPPPFLKICSVPKMHACFSSKLPVEVLSNACALAWAFTIWELVQPAVGDLCLRSAFGNRVSTHGGAVTA